MSKELKVGDVVTMVSGGPKMSVELLSEAGAAHQAVSCSWFDKELIYHSISVPLECLKKQKDDAGDSHE